MTFKEEAGARRNHSDNPDSPNEGIEDQGRLDATAGFSERFIQTILPKLRAGLVPTA